MRIVQAGGEVAKIAGGFIRSIVVYSLVYWKILLKRYLIIITVNYGQVNLDLT